MPIVERLQIDLVGDNPGAEKIEHLRRGVAVGDKGTIKPGRACLLEDGDGPFGGDERFVVAGHDEPGPFALGDVDELPRRDLAHRHRRGRVAQGLAGDPVLAIGTMQIAAHHAEGQGIAAGMDVKKRLLFDRIALQPGHVTERNAQAGRCS